MVLNGSVLVSRVVSCDLLVVVLCLLWLFSVWNSQYMLVLSGWVYLVVCVRGRLHHLLPNTDNHSPLVLVVMYQTRNWITGDSHHDV